MFEERKDTKICKCCGVELPLTDFILKQQHNNKEKTYYSANCRKCTYKLRTKNKWKINDDAEIYIPRKFKDIKKYRVLDLSSNNINISLINDDEIFVVMTDYIDSWISNYGRVIYKSKGNYYLKSLAKYSDGIRCVLPKCVYNDSLEKWVINRVTCYIAKEVVSNFVYNDDVQNNTYVWHTDFDKHDNYYKHLYPLNKDQYFAVKMNYLNNGGITEEEIIKIKNDIKYKPEGWNKKLLQPIMCGIGYRGKSDIDFKSKSYIAWHDMINRCYNDKFHARQTQYTDCEVCEEWLNYYNFQKWYDENYYTIGDEQMDLDKDILYKGNKLYSPETCCIITHSINTLFLNGKGNRGDLPVGVFYDRYKGKYRACMAYKGNTVKLGTFNSPIKAFTNYKNYKENTIKNLAEQYKERIPDKVYKAMIGWTITYND